MNLFMTIKAAVTVKQAAEFYGLKVDHSGMTRCPFHADKTPSMKLNDDYYYCFGCQESGDVIDLVAHLFGLSMGDAAKKLAYDFGISPDPTPMAMALPKPKDPEEDVYHCAGVMLAYERHLKKLIETYAPKDPDEEWDARFCAACHKLPRVEATVDDLFSPDMEERMETAAWLMENGTITKIENYFANRKEAQPYGESEEAAA